MPDPDRGHRYRWGRILCLEGEWEEDLRDRSSVLPILQLLQAVHHVRFVHRDVGTVAELMRYLGRWIDQPLDYYTLYLAFHGTEKGLTVADAPEENLSLARLAADLEGDLDDCVIYLGACSVMRVESEVQNFLERTGARAVMGYTTDVDWIDSAAMDMIVLAHLASYEKVGTALGTLARADEYESLRSHLGFACSSIRGTSND